MITVWRTLTAALTLLSHAHIALVCAAVVIDVVILLLMGWRWHGLLKSLHVRLGPVNVLLTNAAGNAVTNLTPARAVGGDALRVASVRARSGASLGVAMASVLYDRLTDLAGVSILALLATPRLEWLTRRPTTRGLLGMALGLTAVALVGVLCRGRLTLWLARWRALAKGVRLQRDAAAVAVGISLFVWLLDACRIMVEAAALDAHLGLSHAAAISLARLVSGAAPVPAGLGVVDAALVGTILWAGLPPETAAALALFERAVVYGWATLLGALSLAWLGGRAVVSRSVVSPPPASQPVGSPQASTDPSSV